MTERSGRPPEYPDMVNIDRVLSELEQLPPAPEWVTQYLNAQRDRQTVPRPLSDPDVREAFLTAIEEELGVE